MSEMMLALSMCETERRPYVLCCNQPSVLLWWFGSRFLVEDRRGFAVDGIISKLDHNL